MRLAEQLRVDQRRIDWVAERDDILHATAVSVLVGTGTERHGASVTIWPATPARPHPMAGQTIGGQVMPMTLPARPAHLGSIRVHCGAQRGRSSVRSVSLDAPVTCERCLASPYWRPVESLPEDVLTTNPRTWAIEPKEA